jgi:hypothetical protein
MEVCRCYEYEQIVADNASYSAIYVRKDFLAKDSRDGTYKHEQRIAHTNCIAVSLVSSYACRSQYFCTWC